MKILPKFLILKSLILCSIVLYGQRNNNRISHEDIYKRELFKSYTVDGVRSMNDGEHFTTLENKLKITQYSYETGEAIGVIYSAIKEDFDIDDYMFSPDESKILLVTDKDLIYRRSFTAKYYIYDIATKKLEKLSSNGKQMFAAFSPNSDKIGFVRKNNIFIKDLKTGIEEKVTDDGKFNFIINGATDWVYEEEFSFTKAFFWSPKGDKIAFYKFDESEVKVFNMTKYNNELYPENYAYKYPKAGEKNSVVSIHVYDLNTQKTISMDVGSEKDQYIPRIKWTKENNKLAIVRKNRLQNQIEILLANTDSGKSKVIYAEKNKYYITRIEDSYMTLTDDGKYFVINSEKDGWNHLYLYTIEGKFVNQVTKGKWEVTKFIGIDSKAKTLYYQSTEESPLCKTMYSIKLDGSKKKKLSNKKGNNLAKFSKGFKYYINYYSNANSPMYVSLHNKRGATIRVLEDNQVLEKRIKEYHFSPVEFFTIQTPSSKWDLNAYMIKPPYFDESKEYPLFMYLYGGPGSQSVTDNWSNSRVYFQLLAQKGYIVVCVDNRGTGGRGEEFKKMTYKQLGKNETIDQIEAAEYLSNLPYVDEERTGIYGWSYGGFMSSLCMFKGNDVFEMGIAIAPVTHYKYYDSIYTELYMGLPKDNTTGYESNAPLNHVSKLKGKYLLIHGTADDNVHIQNSIELSEKLVQANKQFEMHYYMDRAHGISGGNTSLHLRKKMTGFILENL